MPRLEIAAWKHPVPECGLRDRADAAQFAEPTISNGKSE